MPRRRPACAHHRHHIDHEPQRQQVDHFVTRASHPHFADLHHALFYLGWRQLSPRSSARSNASPRGSPIHEPQQRHDRSGNYQRPQHRLRVALILAFLARASLGVVHASATAIAKSAHQIARVCKSSRTSSEIFTGVLAGTHCTQSHFILKAYPEYFLDSR